MTTPLRSAGVGCESVRRDGRALRHVRFVREGEDLELRYSPDATRDLVPAPAQHQTLALQTLPREPAAGHAGVIWSLRHDIDVRRRLALSGLGAQKDPGGQLLHRKTCQHGDASIALRPPDHLVDHGIVPCIAGVLGGAA